MSLRALGRITPENFDHIAANPLGAIELTTPKPVSIGINWYTDFDSPVQIDGSWHLPEAKNIRGTIRGGHCVCLAPMGGQKLVEAHPAWQTFYNQGQEGACEGFGHAHALTLETLKTYDAWYIYDQARTFEGTFPSGEGTTNHSAAAVMQKLGVPGQSGALCTRGATDTAAEHVTNVRWTKDAQEVLEALQRPNAAAVPFLNSWGTDYPLITWMPVSTLELLLSQEGEADVITAA